MQHFVGGHGPCDAYPDPMHADPQKPPVKKKRTLPKRDHSAGNNSKKRKTEAAPKKTKPQSQTNEDIAIEALLQLGVSPGNVSRTQDPEVVICEPPAKNTRSSNSTKCGKVVNDLGVFVTPTNIQCPNCESCIQPTSAQSLKCHEVHL